MTAGNNEGEFSAPQGLATDPAGPIWVTDTGPIEQLTTITYDAAGRPLTTKHSGGGAPIPKIETLYDESTGRPTTQQFVCESECEGFDSEALTTTYDTLGRPISYKDADGNTSGAAYDPA